MAAEVLIVGAGPSGLFAAVELARHGVRARLVEREPQPHRQARATALQPATLEILAQAGVAEQVLEASVRLDYARVFDASLRPVSEMAFAGAGSPWNFECSLPRWRTEAGRIGRPPEYLPHPRLTRGVRVVRKERLPPIGQPACGHRDSPELTSCFRYKPRGACDEYDRRTG
jgi:succinate dehydrogenase/fumarate reductase flavoprotein subunit